MDDDWGYPYDSGTPHIPIPKDGSTKLSMQLVGLDKEVHISAVPLRSKIPEHCHSKSNRMVLGRIK